MKDVTNFITKKKKKDVTNLGSMINSGQISTLADKNSVRNEREKREHTSFRGATWERIDLMDRASERPSKSI